MVESVIGVLQSAAQSLRIAAELLGWSTLIFGSLAVLVKGREALDALRRAARELRVNLAILFLDALFVAPVLAILTTLIRAGIDHYSLAVIDGGLWSWLGKPTTFVTAVFIGDFISYWRHRLEHTRWLWPAHAIHHSDTEMTWLTLSRFHPLNRLTHDRCGRHAAGAPGIS